MGRDYSDVWNIYSTLTDLYAKAKAGDTFEFESITCVTYEQWREI